MVFVSSAKIVVLVFEILQDLGPLKEAKGQVKLLIGNKDGHLTTNQSVYPSDL